MLTPSFTRPVVFLDTASQAWPWDDLPDGSTSFVNELEAEWVVETCRRFNGELAQLGVPGTTSISVLAFYGAQARLIRHKLGYPRYSRFPKLDFKVVDSIDRIQGQQSDIVVISFCRTFGRPAERNGRPRPPGRAPAGWAAWLQNLNRLNVACTRARRSIVLVGHRPTLSALRATPEVQRFYANMFDLQQRGIMEVNVDWTKASHRQRR
ncbi:C-terminal helicase domain-containing protein [Hamadaea sp. NPDC051192]|uniref:C-terminal helicase domain-containing protein n=1 Tax=Hamadaea sp. NPDC051192 TaxID=3154940 RepID=UPI0034379F8A